MKDEETKQEKQIREISERLNPYAQVCPNRHLWSEGFRAAFSYFESLGGKIKLPEK